MSNYKINRADWVKLSFFEQMGNIGSEVGRAINAQRRGNSRKVDGAIDRVLDLFDATIECLIYQKSPRVREVFRSREEFLRLFFDGTFEADADNIERYFIQFAIATRNQRQ